VVVLAPCCQAPYLISIGGLIVVRDETQDGSVVCKLQDDVGTVCCHTVLRVQGVQEGTEYAPLGPPVLRVSEEEVCLPILTTWGLLVRKSRIQLHRGVLRPRLLSVWTSLAGTIVLNAEL